jgi:uncharacterized damage-inducible protein DinB
LDKALVKDTRTINKDDILNKTIIAEKLVESSLWVETILQRAEENNGVIPRYKHGANMLVSSYIAHEAHHRGNILLVLKQKGFKLNDTLKYHIWDWNRIYKTLYGEM